AGGRRPPEGRRQATRSSFVLGPIRGRRRTRPHQLPASPAHAPKRVPEETEERDCEAGDQREQGPQCRKATAGADVRECRRGEGGGKNHRQKQSKGRDHVVVLRLRRWSRSLRRDVRHSLGQRPLARGSPRGKEISGKLLRQPGSFRYGARKLVTYHVDELPGDATVRSYFEHPAGRRLDE